MDSIDLTVMLDGGEGWPCVAALVRFGLDGVVGVRALDPDQTPVWLLAGIRHADALLRAGLPLDRLDLLVGVDPDWTGTAVLPVLRTLAQVQAAQGGAARDALLLRRYPRVRDAAARERLHLGTVIKKQDTALKELRRLYNLAGKRARGAA